LVDRCQADDGDTSGLLLTLYLRQVDSIPDSLCLPGKDADHVFQRVAMTLVDGLRKLLDPRGSVELDRRAS
jgi:hypothetical protein